MATIPIHKKGAQQIERMPVKSYFLSKEEIERRYGSKKPPDPKVRPPIDLPQGLKHHREKLKAFQEKQEKEQQKEPPKLSKEGALKIAEKAVELYFEGLSVHEAIEKAREWGECMRT